jgi:hypothetical protein
MLVSQEQSVDLQSPEIRKRLSSMLVKLLDHWKLSGSEKCLMLGLSENSRSTVVHYAKGQAPLHSGPDIDDRAANLLAINKALRILYPQEEDGYEWMTRPNNQFKGESPVKFMVKHGLRGIYSVRALLDRRRGQ